MIESRPDVDPHRPRRGRSITPSDRVGGAAAGGSPASRVRRPGRRARARGRGLAGSRGPGRQAEGPQALAQAVACRECGRAVALLRDDQGRPPPTDLARPGPCPAPRASSGRWVGRWRPSPTRPGRTRHRSWANLALRAWGESVVRNRLRRGGERQATDSKARLAGDRGADPQAPGVRSRPSGSRRRRPRAVLRDALGVEARRLGPRHPRARPVVQSPARIEGVDPHDFRESAPWRASAGGPSLEGLQRARASPPPKRLCRFVVAASGSEGDEGWLVGRQSRGTAGPFAEEADAGGDGGLARGHAEGQRADLLRTSRTCSSA